MTGSSLTLGAAGSRRTVYLVDENSKLPDSTTGTSPTAAAATSIDTETTAANNNNNNNGNNNSTTSATDQAPSTLLMYNRISNVINDPKIVGSASSMPLSQETALANSPSNGTNEKRKPDDNAVWYEYGCV